MAAVVKGLLIIIFGFVIFGRDYFSSGAVYWSLYVVMFALIPLLWQTMYWISKKKAQAFLKADKIDCDFFVGKVPGNSQDDLQRGRLCFIGEEIKLVSKKGRNLEIVWNAEIRQIKSVGFGTVAGVRKGFTLHFEDSEVSFVSARLFKQRNELYTALHWNMQS